MQRKTLYRIARRRTIERFTTGGMVGLVEKAGLAVLQPGIGIC